MFARINTLDKKNLAAQLNPRLFEVLYLTPKLLNPSYDS